MSTNDKPLWVTAHEARTPKCKPKPPGRMSFREAVIMGGDNWRIHIQAENNLPPYFAFDAWTADRHDATVNRLCRPEINPGSWWDWRIGS